MTTIWVVVGHGTVQVHTASNYKRQAQAKMCETYLNDIRPEHQDIRAWNWFKENGWSVEKFKQVEK